MYAIHNFDVVCFTTVFLILTTAADSNHSNEIYGSHYKEYVTAAIKCSK